MKLVLKTIIRLSIIILIALSYYTHIKGVSGSSIAFGWCVSCLIILDITIFKPWEKK